LHAIRGGGRKRNKFREAKGKKETKGRPREAKRSFAGRPLRKGTPVSKSGQIPRDIAPSGLGEDSRGILRGASLEEGERVDKKKVERICFRGRVKRTENQTGRPGALVKNYLKSSNGGKPLEITPQTGDINAGGLV